MRARTEEARGWGIRVQGKTGAASYLISEFFFSKKGAKRNCLKANHRPMEVVILPLCEFKRLKRLAKHES